MSTNTEKSIPTWGEVTAFINTLPKHKSILYYKHLSPIECIDKVYIIEPDTFTKNVSLSDTVSRVNHSPIWLTLWGSTTVNTTGIGIKYILGTWCLSSDNGSNHEIILSHELSNLYISDTKFTMTDIRFNIAEFHLNSARIDFATLPNNSIALFTECIFLGK